MRALLMTTAVVTAAIALSGCPDHKEPIPGPKSAAERAPGGRAAASEINCFRGHLVEVSARAHGRGPGGGGLLH